MAITFITRDVLMHIDARHGAAGTAAERFDTDFLTGVGGYGVIARLLGEANDVEMRFGGDGLMAAFWYLNFHRLTGTVAENAARRRCKGVQMVSDPMSATGVVRVRTMYPRGWL